MNDILPAEVEFDAAKAGEWIYPIPHGYIMECCDCGLQHRIDFAVVRKGKTKRTGEWKAFWQNQRFRVALRAWRV